LRYSRVVDCSPSESRLAHMPPNIKFVSGIKPNEVWLFTQFFKHKDNKRHQEIKECLRQNVLCSHIDKIVLINEKDYSNEYNKYCSSPKIQQVVTRKRLTYGDFLEYVYTNVPNGVYVILSNADIYFGDSLLELWNINMNDKMMGLLRWDIDADGDAKIFGPRADSQDSWIFLSDSIKSRTWDFSKFNFQLGQPGCDNAFSAQIFRQKFMLCNPSLVFKSYHLHNTNIRNYHVRDSILTDLYINIAPTYIIDSKQEICPNGAPTIINNELVSFEVKSSSMSNEITICTMLEKEGRYKWEPSVENHYFQPSIPVYKWNKSSVTPNGLVFDLYTIYMGKHKDDHNFNYWGNSTVHILSQLHY